MRSIAGRPRHIVARALRDPVEHYQLRREDFLDVIDGMEMDAREDLRAPDLATLDLYCSRVASAVGHLSVHVFGDQSEAAHSVADSLGRALQLTNILRDLDEDAGRRPPLSAAGDPRSAWDRNLGPGGGFASSGVAGGLPRSGGDRRKPFCRGRPRNAAMLAPRHAPGGGHGGDLPRDAVGAAAVRMARPDETGSASRSPSSSGWCCDTD